MKYYSKSKYLEYIRQGNLHGTVDYLKQFSSNERLLKKYLRLYVNVPRKLLKMSDNKAVNDILQFFQEYYYQVFWVGLSEISARRNLTESLAQHFEMILPNLENDEEVKKFFNTVIERKIKYIVTKEGFFYLGGEVQGYLGPFIWRITEPTIFNVELPSGNYEYKINITKDFISRSWMAYISFGKIGVGSWKDEDGLINFIWLGDNKMKNSSFQVDFLKYEAQCAYDKEHHKDITQLDLVYRAKLVQLIYAVNMKMFNFFFSNAEKNTKNGYEYASYLVIRNISKIIFGIEYQADLAQWKGKNKKISDAALKLLNAYKEKK